jgi:GNAT superfamily N-acetyltransferase
VVGAPVGGGPANAGSDVTPVSHINPQWLDPAGYVAFLNRAFPGQWDRKAYDWYLRRPFNGVHSDLLLRTRDEQIVAGMGLSHRQIKVGAGRSVNVCVISAAATAPGERGRGHYAALLQLALERARDRGWAAVLGFVTRDNASGRGLTRLGSRSIPSFYVFSGDRPRVRAAARLLRTEPVEQAQERIAGELTRAPRAPAAHFHYERDEDWKSQLVRRPHPVRLVRWGHDSLALMESVGSTDRLQWLACPHEKAARNVAALAADSAAAGRRFFTYTLDALLATAARRAGLRIKEGYLMLLPTGHSTVDWAELVRATWAVQSGDRI